MRLAGSTIIILMCVLVLRVAGWSESRNPLQVSVAHPPEQGRIADIRRIEEAAENARMVWTRDSQQQAAALLSSAAAAWLSSGELEEAAKCMRMEAPILQSLGDTARARSVLEQSLDLQGITDNERIRDLCALALLDFQSGRLDRGRETLDRARALIPTDAEPSSRAQFFATSGEYLLYRRDLQNSITQYKQAVDLYADAGEAKARAESQLGLGYVYMVNGDYQDALLVLTDALSYFQGVGDARLTAMTDTAIGHVYTAQTDKKKALDSYKSALKLYPDGLDLGDRAILDNGLGSVYEDYGEWELSLDLRLDALRLFDTVGDLYGKLATLPSIAKLNDRLGNFEEAEQNLTVAEKLALDLHDEYLVSMIRWQRGDHLADLDPERAMRNYDDALGFFRRHNNKREIAGVSEELGEVYIAKRRNDVAVDYLTAAARLFSEVEDRFGESAALYNLARIERDEDRLDSAIDDCRRSLAITEELSSVTPNSKVRETYLSEVHDRYGLYIDLLMKKYSITSNIEYAKKALQESEMCRARTLLENIRLSGANMPARPSSGLIDRERSVRAALARASDELADAVSGGAEKVRIADMENRVDRLKNDLEDVKTELRETDPGYSSLSDPRPLDIGFFQQRILNDRSAAFEFFVGERMSFVWVITSTEVFAFNLPSGSELDQYITDIRKYLQTPSPEPGETLEEFQHRSLVSESLYWKSAHELSTLLLGQASDLEMNRRLVIIPDGKLNYIPFAALPLPGTNDDSPILLTNEVVNEPSAGALVELAARGDAEMKPPDKDLLVISDPVFTSDDARLAGSNSVPAPTRSAPSDNFRFVRTLEDLSRLAGSAKEADSIAKLFAPDREVALAGFDANRERVLGSKPADFRILHFATHAMIDEQHPSLTGLVLSRFDSDGNQVDELLRLDDIYDLGLKADVVVLSACNTGVGKNVKGEGLASLSNGFIEAGAGSVISSLWKVDDQAANSLMTKFYQRLSGGSPPSEALRQAQLDFLGNPVYRFPSNWAAFTFEGDFRRQLRFSGNDSRMGKRLALLVLLAVGLIVIVVLLLRSRFIRQGTES